MPNLADPGYEPTDAELEDLMERAFADLVSRRLKIAEDLRARIRGFRETSRIK